MDRLVHIAACLAGILGLTGVGVAAAQSPEAPTAQPAPVDPANSALSEGQLDQLTAPIALYPDPLLGQILAASTYPLEVVEAHRWLQDPANAALQGDALGAALAQQSWDQSVKSLVPFPQVLQMMDGNLEWTERIGDAFLAQQGPVMDSIQRLRRRATAAGALKSTAQQTVASEDQQIEIQPADPDVVYVPYYDPGVIFGPWAWAEYPPFFFAPPAGIVIGAGLWLGFGLGLPILGPFWGWDRWDWRHHAFSVAGGYGGFRAGPWAHDPAHRGGVPYRNAGLSVRFQAQSDAARREVRGFPTAVPGDRGGRTESRAAPESRVAPALPERSMGSGVRTPPPAFESMSRGSQVHQDSARGAFSRAAPTAPAARGGGGGGGGGARGGGGGRGGERR
jgi:hypothetical protein